MVQVAEGDWVATRFKRTVKYEGRIMSREGMQFKQIKNGKIIRSWELFSPVQFELGTSTFYLDHLTSKVGRGTSEGGGGTSEVPLSYFLLVSFFHWFVFFSSSTIEEAF